MRHNYWWDDKPLGNDAWTAAALPPSIATQASAAFVVGNGMRSTPTVTYFVDVHGETARLTTRRTGCVSDN